MCRVRKANLTLILFSYNHDNYLGSRSVSPHLRVSLFVYISADQLITLFVKLFYHVCHGLHLDLFRVSHVARTFHVRQTGVTVA